MRLRLLRHGETHHLVGDFVARELKMLAHRAMNPTVPCLREMPLSRKAARPVEMWEARGKFGMGYALYSFWVATSAA